MLLGGLLSSTRLDILVTPAVFLKFGRASAKWLARGREVVLAAVVPLA